MRLRRLAAVGTIALATTAGSLILASPANAAVSCSIDYACLHYNSNNAGALYKQYYAIPDYAGLNLSASTSTNGGSGAGQAVKNNSASVDNWDFDLGIRVYYNSNYNASFASQAIAKGGFANLNSTMKNNNASGDWY